MHNTLLSATRMIAICLFPLLAVAQVTWEKVNGPNEGVNAMTATNNNDIFLGTTNYGVFLSSDAGVSWDNISQDIPDPMIRALGTSSTDEVFAGTGSHGIYKYSNGGWTQINNGLPSGNLAVWNFSKGLNGVMYMVTTSDNIYRWDGATWTSIKFNLPALVRTVNVGSTGIVYAGCFNSGVYKFDGVSNWTSLGAMPNNFITKMVISATDTLYVACNSNNIYRIPAAGGAWTLINTGLPASNATTMGIDAQSNLFLGFSENGYGHLYRSVNRGGTWSKVTGGLLTSSFNCMCVTPSNLLFAGASGPFKSANQGGAWTDMNPGLDARKAIVSFTGTPDGKLYLGTQYDGVWRSDDNGNTWQYKITGLTTSRMFQITKNAAGNLLLSAFIPGSTNVGIIFRSTNNGDSWAQVASNGTDIYTKIKQHNADTIWATGRFGGPVLSYSVDNGASWTNRPISGFSAVWDIQFGAGSTIFLGSESEGVSRSFDGGANWTLGVGNTIPWYGNVIDVEMDNNGYLFAATDWWTNMLWFSAPGSNGDVWTEFLDTDLSGLSDINDVVFDNNNNAYIATNNGLYTDPVYMASSPAWDANTNWVTSSTGLPSEATAGEFGFDAAGYIYLVTYFNTAGQGGLYRSTTPVSSPLPIEFADGPRAKKEHETIDIQWSTTSERNFHHFEVEKSSNGTDFRKMTVVQPDKNSGKHHYATTDNTPVEGINYYRIKVVDNDGKYQYSPIASCQFNTFLVHIFPNPVTDLLHIQSDKTIEQIDIIDISGRVVKSISFPSGNIPVGDLPGGMYVARLRIGGNAAVIRFTILGF